MHFVGCSGCEKSTFRFINGRKFQSVCFYLRWCSMLVKCNLMCFDERLKDSIFQVDFWCNWKRRCESVKKKTIQIVDTSIVTDFIRWKIYRQLCGSPKNSIKRTIFLVYTVNLMSYCHHWAHHRSWLLHIFIFAMPSDIDYITSGRRARALAIKRRSKLFWRNKQPNQVDLIKVSRYDINFDMTNLKISSDGHFGNLSLV